LNPVDNDVTLRVFVVDDEALIRWSVSEKLSEHGHHVREAFDGRSTLQTLGDGAPPPDVVLLDLRLPDSSDLSLLRQVRQLAPGAAVILMTAYGTPDVLQGALDLGAYRVLSKPFDVAQLPALVLEAHAASHG
jgi:DNA-binding NtrC family response regulator